MIKIYNESCLETMKHIQPKSVGCVMTSPPYNMTDRKGGYADSGRYDVYRDWMTEEEYLDFTLRIFNGFGRVLANDGVVVYNFGYSVENPSLPYSLVSKIVHESQFGLVDTICWKKKCGIPFPANRNRLTRIWEFVWVFANKGMEDKFAINRKWSEGDNGQLYYENVFNFVEAKNNDGKCDLNQATFSTEFARKMLSIYCPKDRLVYDPFMGTGTTANACKDLSLMCIGSELSANQCAYAKKRIDDMFETVEIIKGE